jgi:lariat debranching enzyme
LNAIYESVKKASEVRGWDGVDLLIIGGDFQVLPLAFSAQRKAAKHYRQ